MLGDLADMVFGEEACEGGVGWPWGPCGAKAFS